MSESSKGPVTCNQPHKWATVGDDSLPTVLVACSECGVQTGMNQYTVQRGYAEGTIQKGSGEPT